MVMAHASSMRNTGSGAPQPPYNKKSKILQKTIKSNENFIKFQVLKGIFLSCITYTYTRQNPCFSYYKKFKILQKTIKSNENFIKFSSPVFYMLIYTQNKEKWIRSPIFEFIKIKCVPAIIRTHSAARNLHRTVLVFI